MLKKIIIIFFIISILIAVCGNVDATNENIIIEKTVTNYEQFSSEKGGEVVLKIKNINLKQNATYKYKLNYNELETEWYEICNKDFEKNILDITLEKAKPDVLSILKITDAAYLTIQETDENFNEKNVLENKKIDISLSLSKGFKVGHWTTGYHGIAHTYNVKNILYKYVKVQDIKIIEDYLDYLRGYDSNKDNIYWGYYVDNLIDEMNIDDNIPNEGWETLKGDTTTTQPSEEGLYFIWIKAPKTEDNKEIIGCVFSKRFNEISVLESQLEDAKESQEELNATVSYNPTSNTTGSVTATIKTNRTVKEVNGWVLSKDGMTLQKKYSKNVKETVHLIDMYGNTKDIIIEISNIIKDEDQQPEQLEKPREQQSTEQSIQTDKTENSEKKSKDATVASGKLPQTGISKTIIIIYVTIISMIIYKKNDKYKDIK